MAGLLRSEMRAAHQRRRNRTLFISDLHLATSACRAQAPLDFLQHNGADAIIDFWRVKRGAPWPPTQNEVVQTLLRKLSAMTLPRLQGAA